MDRKDIRLENTRNYGHDDMEFDAELLVKGKKIAHVYGNAIDREYEFTVLGSSDSELNENKKVFEELEKFISTLTPWEGQFGDNHKEALKGATMVMTMGMFAEEFYITGFHEYIKEKPGSINWSSLVPDFIKKFGK